MTKPIRYTAAGLLAALAVVASFLAYGEMRTFVCNVGFSIGSAATGVAFVFLPLLSGFLCLAVLLTLCGATRVPTLRGAMGLTACCLLGIAAAEVWIVMDERSFDQEVKRSGPGTTFARDRSWPFDGCSLVYSPGLGTHATD
ncbi:MAG TPA: hypothetical protein VG433_02190 [Pirellulales bacterium]|nr:hypothetical protein [Pirellulales bacterium]